MPSKRKFYKTHVSVVIVSEGEVPENVDLERIHNEGDSGEWVVDFSIDEIEKLDGEECANELHRLGSQPEFFTLDDDGNDT